VAATLLLGVREEVRDPDGARVIDAENEAVAVDEKVADTEGLTETEGDRLTDDERLADTDGRSEVDGDPLAADDWLADSERLTEADTEMVTVFVATKDELALVDEVTEADGIKASLDATVSGQPDGLYPAGSNSITRYPCRPTPFERDPPSAMLPGL
jgi:hypothetical protein